MYDELEQALLLPLGIYGLLGLISAHFVSDYF